jgi:putative hydrolase of the HAD superfamily
MPERLVTWIFDLDNTLHDARPHIFPHINRSMTEYLEQMLALDSAAAGDITASTRGTSCARPIVSPTSSAWC